MHLDRQQAEQHARWLAGEQPVLIAAIRKGARVLHRRGRIAELWPWIRDRQAQDYDIYVTMNETAGSRRRRADVIRIRAVWVDADEPGEMRTDWLLEPSFIVESSPGRFHYVWLASHDDLEDFEAVMRGMPGDPAAKDPARVLRLLGTLNQKRGAMARLVACTGRLYTWSEIKAAFPPVVVEKNVSTAPEHDPERADSALMAIPNSGAARLAYEHWLPLLFAHKAAGGTPETLLAWTNDPEKERETRRIWETAEVDGGIGPGTLYKTAREHGWIEDSALRAAITAGGPVDAKAIARASVPDQQVALRLIPELAAEVEAARDELAIEGFEDLSDAKGGRFALQQAAEFAAVLALSWLIKLLLPAAGIAMLFGASGAGKSFIALCLAMHIARGVPWRGRPTRRGRVVYIVAEGAAGFRKRLAAYALAHGVDLAGVDLYVIADAPNLLTMDWEALAQSIGAADLVVIDTLAQTTPGANENAADDMGRAMANVRKLQERTGGLVLLIHHSGKDSERGARGWSGIRAAVDTELEVVRDRAHRELRTTKQKDGDDEGAFPFELRTIQIGIDEEGDPITSCVVEYLDSTPRRRGEPTGDVQRVVYRAAPGTVDEVITRAVEQMPYDPKRRDKRREHARRALQGLITSNWLCQVGDIVARPGEVPMPSEDLF